MGGDTVEASLVVVMTQQGPSSFAAGELAPTEASWWGGGGLDGASVRRAALGLNLGEWQSKDMGRISDRVGGPTELGAMVFALDDATEGLEWRGLHSSLGGVAQFLTNVLSALNSTAPTGQV
jgi:hypothetical protein